MFNEPGPTVSPAEWADFVDVYRELLTAGDVAAVALCGSLPPGVPVGAYAELVREARASGVFVLLDTAGEPLRRGLAARPDLIKPNADELAGLTGFSEPDRAARDARRRGARAVAASLGPDGMLAVTEEGDWRALPPSTAVRQSDRRGRLRGGRAALGARRGPALAAAAGPGGRAVSGDGGRAGRRGVRRGGVRGAAAEGGRRARRVSGPTRERPDAGAAHRAGAPAEPPPAATS